MSDKSFVKLHRKIADWEWYTDANTFRVFMHLLLKANYKESKFRGHHVPKGSLVTGYEALAAQLSITVQNARTSIKHLKMTGEITVQSTNNFSILTLVKWENYQDRDKIESHKLTGKLTGKLTNDQQTGNKRVTNDQQTGNKQLTASKEGKKVRRKEGKKQTSNNAKINFASFPSPPDKDLLADWFKVRKTKRLANTQTAMDAVGREMHKALSDGYTVDECLRIMVEKSWGGLTASWLASSSFSDSGNKLHIVKSATFSDVKNEGGMTW